MTHWHALRLSSDALKLKARKIAYWGPKGGRYIHPIQRATLTIQKSMDALGVELYIPWERIEIQNRQKRKVTERDYPLIPGYAFVRNVTDFAALSQADGVSEILSNFVTDEPLQIDAMVLHEIMMLEKELFDRYQRQKAYRSKNKGSKHKFKGKLGSNEALQALKDMLEVSKPAMIVDRRKVA